MDCRLTLACMMAALFVGSARGELPKIAAPHDDQNRESAKVGEATLTVHWEGLPLRDAVSRLVETTSVDVFVDRRVDPAQLVTLSADNATAEKILEKLATALSLGVSRLDSVLYLGPARSASELNQLAALRRKDVIDLSPQDKRSWSMKSTTSWPRLTEPRDLVTRLLQSHELKATGLEQIPHDLWPAGRLPKLTLADELTLLLVGFDLTYRLVPEELAIEIIPIVEPLAAAPHVATTTKPSHPASDGKTQHTKQLFTLRVQEQPVRKVLDQLVKQLHLEMKVDDAALQAAGRSLDQRVSFEVRNVDLDGLFDALLRPADLTYTRDGDRLLISPR
jgi:type II secretory pathway component GspD/PulD (secretin)